MSSLLEKELDKLNVFDQEVVFSVLSKALGEFIGIKIVVCSHLVYNTKKKTPLSHCGQWRQSSLRPLITLRSRE